MNNTISTKIRIVKKQSATLRQPVKMRCGSVISTITFPERKDGRVKGEVKHHTDYSIAPTVRPIKEETPEWI